MDILEGTTLIKDDNYTMLSDGTIRTSNPNIYLDINGELVNTPLELREFLNSVVKEFIRLKRRELIKNCYAE